MVTNDPAVDTVAGILEASQVGVLWDGILQELSELQDRESVGFERPVFNPFSHERVGMLHRSGEELDGAVVNPMCGYPLMFDTACAATVFATQYQLTGKRDWKRRAEQAISSIRKIDPYPGLPEPRWDPIGWHFSEGSLSVTGTVLDCYWTALDRLGKGPTAPVDVAGWQHLAEYLERCRHGKGRFAHNVVPLSAKAWDVQNTTAFAFYLRQYANEHDDSVDHILGDSIRDAVRHLVSGQRSDGFWPYLYPGRFQRMLFRSPLRPVLNHPIARTVIFRGDASILMVDSAHHCYVFYYLLLGAAQRDDELSRHPIERGWNWIESKLVGDGDGGLEFDFDWEPGPDRVRYCNFYDTTTYFLILAMLPHLVAKGHLGFEEATRMGNGIARHVESRLLDENERPTIRPHECGYEARRRILPAVWGGSAVKGAFLAKALELRT